jgi:hypothetical protein
MKDKQQQRKSPLNKKKKKHEQLSTKDLEELMGIHRDTYTRRNGAVRRK